MDNKLTILSACLLLPMLFVCTGMVAQIDVRGFRDSSHHWYDIYDTDKVINPLPDQARYKPEETVGIADNILLYQKENGGWPKNYDMLAILTPGQKDSLQKSAGETNTTFDNSTTHSQIEFLAEAYARTGDTRYRDACLRGLDFILAAQYPNGGWPQFYPDTSGYRKYITFNDGAMIGVMTVLHRIDRNEPRYAFVDAVRRKRIHNAFEKGLDCIIHCQIVENGKRTSWCQQHDNIDFRPRNARTFELASICNDEGAGIVLFLMSIDNPGKEIIRSIQGAVQWFVDSRITGVRVKTVPAPTTRFVYRTSQEDRIVEMDSSAPPIWTRFYELGTHRPFFCNRDGKPVYSMAEVERERREGYRWYTYAPQEVLDRYPAWQRKWNAQGSTIQK